jgi:hypothetical protein
MQRNHRLPRVLQPAGAMYRAYPSAGSMMGRATPVHGSGDDAGGIDLSASIESPYVKQRVVVGEDYETYIAPAGLTDPQCVQQTGGDSFAYWVASQGRCGCRGEYYPQTYDDGAKGCGCPFSDSDTTLDMIDPYPDSRWTPGMALPRCNCPPGSTPTGTGATKHCQCPAGQEGNADFSRCVPVCTLPQTRNAAGVCVAPTTAAPAAVQAAARTTAATAQQNIAAARTAAATLPAAQRTVAERGLDALGQNLQNTLMGVLSGNTSLASVINGVATQANNVRSAVENLGNLGRTAAAAPSAQQAAIIAQVAPAQQAVVAALAGTENSTQNLANQATIDMLIARVEALGGSVSRVNESTTPAWVVPAAVGGGILLLGLTGLVIYKSSRRPQETR